MAFARELDQPALEVDGMLNHCELIVGERFRLLCGSVTTHPHQRTALADATEMPDETCS